MYIDIFEDKKNEILLVAERSAGKRIYKQYPIDHTYYILDANGPYKDIFGNNAKAIKPSSINEKMTQMKMLDFSQTCEIDVRPEFRCLEVNYKNAPMPDLHVAFFDIETAFDQKRGYADPADPFNPIISISVYLQWMQQMVCLALAPETILPEDAQRIASEVGETIICKNEKEMLSMFIDLVEDADILSGWNSERFDIPYTFNRIVKLLGKNELRKLCLWNLMPKKRNIEQEGGSSFVTFETFGRIHLDYLQLYKKYNYEERHSYSLDSISEIELGERKVPYNGTLDKLYKYDFKKFLEYNIQDTRLLDKLDRKLKYIDLASTIAHSNCIPIPTVMGAVATTEQAIIIEAHNNGMVVPSRQRFKNNDTLKAAGGWVAYPKVGLHRDIGSSDLNSLYPSVLRALNMSPETIIGQVRLTLTNPAIEEWCAKGGTKHTFAAWWNDRFTTLEMEYVLNKDRGTILTLDMADGRSFELSGAEIYELVFNSGQNWHISANGTIFTQDRAGVIPLLLTRWYAERKGMQKIASDYNSLDKEHHSDKTVFLEDKSVLDGICVGEVELADHYNINDVYVAATLKNLVESKNWQEVAIYMKKYGLEVSPDNSIVMSDSHMQNEYYEYWDKAQLVRKIGLNSLYGGLLNEHSRFYDKRLGQSTTLTGRCITRHMASKTNEMFTGIYDHEGDCVIYGDTDSVDGSTILNTSLGKITIEELFNVSDKHVVHAEKEFASNEDVMVMSWDNSAKQPYMGHINYVYRHEVEKELFEIEDNNGNKVIVTEDHSIMVIRNAELLEVKPAELTDSDIILSIVYE
ncbi:DNA polymerase [Pseudomonas phage vB_Pa-PAC2]